jgi:hypothetical protein
MVFLRKREPMAKFCCVADPEPGVLLGQWLKASNGDCFEMDEEPEANEVGLLSAKDVICETSSGVKSCIDCDFAK